MSDYQVTVVDKYGRGLAELVGFEIDNVSEQLDDIESASFKLPIFGNIVMPTNLVPDPSFENGLAGWTFSASMVRQTARVFHGNYSLRFSNNAVTTETSVSPLFAALPSTQYTIQAELLNQLTQGFWRCDVEEYAGDGVTLLATHSLNSTLGLAAWERPSNTFVTNAGCAYMKIAQRANGARGIGYVDSVQVETGPTAHMFVEGEGGACPRVLQDEIQIRRNGLLIFWGVVTKASADRSRIVFLAQGLAWYFKKRLFGKAQRTNLVTNGGFESGLTGLDNWGRVIQNLLTTSPRPTFHVEGTRGMELQLGPTGSGDDTYIYQDIPGTAVPGETYTLAAWYLIRNDGAAVQYAGPALNQRGVYLQLLNAARQIVDESFWPIRLDTQRGIWLRGETAIAVPQDAPAGQYTLQVRLYGVVGMVVYDSCTLVTDERTQFTNQDQGFILPAIVAHAQDPAYNKTQLNITMDQLVTGVYRSAVYHHSDHPVIFDALYAYTRDQQGVDLRMRFTPNSRILTAYFPNYGATKPTFPLMTAKNIAEFTYESDGEETRQSVIVVGLGSGANRDEAAAFDSSAMGGLGLESVETALPYINVDGLGEQAQLRLAARKRLVRIPQITTTPNQSELIANLSAGDIVPVVIDYGWVQELANYRIIKRTLRPKDDSLVYDLNIP